MYKQVMRQALQGIYQWVERDEANLHYLSMNSLILSAPSFIQLKTNSEGKEGAKILQKKTRLIRVLTQLLSHHIIVEGMKDIVWSANFVMKDACGRELDDDHYGMSEEEDRFYLSLDLFLRTAQQLGFHCSVHPHRRSVLQRLEQENKEMEETIRELQQRLKDAQPGNAAQISSGTLPTFQASQALAERKSKREGEIRKQKQLMEEWEQTVTKMKEREDTEQKEAEAQEEERKLQSKMRSKRIKQQESDKETKLQPPINTRTYPKHPEDEDEDEDEDNPHETLLQNLPFHNSNRHVLEVKSNTILQNSKTLIRYETLALGKPLKDVCLSFSFHMFIRCVIVPQGIFRLYASVSCFFSSQVS